MLLKGTYLVYEGNLRKRVQSLRQVMLSWSTWITAPPLPQRFLGISLIYVFIIFVTCWLIVRSLFSGSDSVFCSVHTLFAFFQGSILSWPWDGWGSRGKRKRREQLCLSAGAVCWSWHCAWNSGVLEMWLSPASSWPLSAQLENITCPTPELSVSELCDLSLADRG